MTNVEERVVGSLSESLWNNNEYMALLSSLALIEIDDIKYPKNNLDALGEFVDYLHHILRQPEKSYQDIPCQLVSYHSNGEVFPHPKNLREFVHKMDVICEELTTIRLRKLYPSDNARDFLRNAVKVFYDYAKINYAQEKRPHHCE